ncbi:MAG: hypothetical protein H0T71_06780 [Acidobacteria bacterium]|nr:hypothetical protein [Acidobacteriota bacterium]
MAQHGPTEDSEILNDAEERDVAHDDGVEDEETDEEAEAEAEEEDDESPGRL